MGREEGRVQCHDEEQCGGWQCLVLVFICAVLCFMDASDVCGYERCVWNLADPHTAFPR